jgi:hypothetical protein
MGLPSNQLIPLNSKQRIQSNHRPFNVAECVLVLSTAYGISVEESSAIPGPPRFGGPGLTS